MTMSMVCCCSLAGTAACTRCNRWKEMYGEDNSYSPVDRQNYPKIPKFNVPKKRVITITEEWV